MMQGLIQMVWVAVGGAVGAVARFGLGHWLSRPGAVFFWHTFLANILGSFVFGYVFAWLQRQPEGGDQWQKALLLTGFCGGFTTFSALSYEAWLLLRQQQYQQLAVYYFATIFAGLGALALGHYIYHLIYQP